MKNKKPVSNKHNVLFLKKSYYIILENAAKKTQGWGNTSVENPWQDEKRTSR